MERTHNGDPASIRNLENAIAFYDLAINQKKPLEAVKLYASTNYIQHNPVLADGHDGFTKAFVPTLAKHTGARVVIHRVIAAGDYVWSHVNFVNVFSSEPDDLGVAAVDILRFDPDGLFVEHWDVLQEVGTPEDAVPWKGVKVPAANNNGMF